MAESGRPRVLCVWRKGVEGFKATDLDMLRRAFDVTFLPFRYTPWCVLRMARLVRTHDITYAWFANVWALLAVWFCRLAGRRSVIATGGYDVADVPGMRYGLRRHPVLKHVSRAALRHADLVLPISESARAELLSFVTPRRVEVVYCCGRDVPQEAPTVRKPQVVTVGNIQRSSSVRKGHREFLDVARHLPDVHFVLIGAMLDRTAHALRRVAPSNVEFTGYLNEAEYMRRLCESRVYLQLSRHEGFGVSVVEAMACGCTPVVSSAGSLPEIVGEAGTVVGAGRTDEVAVAVKRLLATDGSDARARSRSQYFSCTRRAERLTGLFGELVRGPASGE
jgi:glycosyltransferase involved in cell wall biosynthesis